MPVDPLAVFGDEPFSIGAARTAGAGRKRTDAPRLARPFAGVRAREAPADVRALAAAYLPKMAPHEFFSHRTAALLHGLWLPLPDQQRLVLDVAVIRPHRAPRDARVQGHHLVERPGMVVRRDGVPVANPIETVCQLATVLSGDDLVTAIERLLPPRHPASARRLEALTRAATDPHRPGSIRLRKALPRVRIGSRSPQETRLRLLMLASGLPEPELSHLPNDPRLEWTEGDLVYPAQKVWIEVEGDQHRTDRRQWMKDVARYELLTDLGWRVIRVTAADIAEPAVTLARIARALHRSG
ncbi:DUF559 domain-containing protein [Amnibacterium endophyticum]|uniref:DUF559 domain-containing protein n=1 Tax=Amnibacterium endophyticum TaxID=2109337 RepID=A0ABW4L9G2_9MICO